MTPPKEIYLIMKDGQPTQTAYALESDANTFMESNKDKGEYSIKPISLIGNATWGMMKHPWDK